MVLSENLIENQIANFEDPIADQIRIFDAAQRLFDNREGVLLDYQIAESSTFTGDASTEKAALEKQEAEDKLRNAKEKYDTFSKNVKDQCVEGRQKKTKLLVDAIRCLALENIEYHEKAIGLWKEFSTSLQQK